MDDPSFFGRNDIVGRWFQRAEMRRLRTAARYARTTTSIMGRPFVVPDGLSFFYSYQEIVKQRNYEFASDSERPRIIDCGANIGLSVLFFKRRYPGSRAIAIEADPAIYSILAANIKAFDCEGVTLVNKALSNADGEVAVRPEGADAGRLARYDQRVGEHVIRVDSTRCSPFLASEPTDFLKLDIEGAEADVLTDCSGALHTVKSIFVEYHSFVGQRQRLDDILHILRHAGFRVQIHTQYASAQPPLRSEVQYGMDLQLNIFGHRHD